ncbi:hypothetical protein [Leyella stercorea]|uniref:hypothetical protein n=1 Tax=Leyella stercorea TaxID=363265 RepID=UPI003FEF87D3
MENNNQNTELELMRSQMEYFKAQLDKQKIVNEKMIIGSMKKSMSWIKRFVYFECCLVPLLAVLSWLAIKEFAHLSWLNYAFLMTMVIVSVIADYRINVSAISDADYSRNNLLTTIKKLTRMKRLRSIEMMIEVPTLFIWLLWSGIEAWIYMPADAPDCARGAVYGGIVGGVIGGVCGLIFAFRIFFKMQRTNDEVISQINELNA